ncbi:MAG: hypothetical protein DHS20C07_31730 [Methyloligella sp.]|nr:MAG: hypothetical protein DHS20C07_31730 [Methyloligella sp.]
MKISLTPANNLIQNYLAPIASHYYDLKTKSTGKDLTPLTLPFASTTNSILEACTKIRLKFTLPSHQLTTKLNTLAHSTTPVKDIITPSDSASYTKIQQHSQTLKAAVGSKGKITTPPFQRTPSLSTHTIINSPLSHPTIDKELTETLSILHSLALSFTIVLNTDQLSNTSLNPTKFPDSLLYSILVKAMSLTYTLAPDQLVLLCGDKLQLSSLEQVINTAPQTSTYCTQQLLFCRHSPKGLSLKPPAGKLAAPTYVHTLLIARSKDPTFLTNFHTNLPLIDSLPCTTEVPPLKLVSPTDETPLPLPPLTTLTFQPWMLSLFHRYSSPSPPNMVYISFSNPRLSWACAHHFASSISFIESTPIALSLSSALAAITHTFNSPTSWTSRLPPAKTTTTTTTTSTTTSEEEPEEEDSTLTQLVTSEAVDMEE